jgi:hypothetical protein
LGFKPRAGLVVAHGLGDASGGEWAVIGKEVADEQAQIETGVYLRLQRRDLRAASPVARGQELHARTVPTERPSANHPLVFGWQIFYFKSW